MKNYLVLVLLVCSYGKAMEQFPLATTHFKLKEMNPQSIVKLFDKYASRQPQHIVVMWSSNHNTIPESLGADYERTLFTSKQINKFEEQYIAHFVTKENQKFLYLEHQIFLFPRAEKASKSCNKITINNLNTYSVVHVQLFTNPKGSTTT